MRRQKNGMPRRGPKTNAQGTEDQRPWDNADAGDEAERDHPAVSDRVKIGAEKRHGDH